MTDKEHDATSPSSSEPCCAKWDTCDRPCTPKGIEIQTRRDAPVVKAFQELVLAVGNHHDAMVATGDLHTPFVRAGDALLAYLGHPANATAPGDAPSITLKELGENALRVLNTSRSERAVPDGWKLVCEKCGADTNGPCGWPTACDAVQLPSSYVSQSP